MHRGTSAVLALVGAALLSVLLVARADAVAVSCANPDALCRGNPCVTGQLEVLSPCVVDFGDRTLVIHGLLKVPNDGVLSLKAGAIEVRRAIVGRHARRNDGRGAAITLTATRGITVRWRIDASGRTTPGTIRLTAGGNIDLLAPVRAATNGPQPTAPGGLVAIDSGGTLTAVKRARIRARGALTPGGQVLLNGAQGVHLQNRISADGSIGGTIAISSQNGDVVVGQRLDSGGIAADGGNASIIAINGRIMLFERVDARGWARGGTITVLGGGPVTALATLRAGSVPHSQTGGSVTLVSHGDVMVGDVINTEGLNGGSVQLSSQSGAMHVIAPIVASGNRGTGGQVSLSGGQIASIASSVDADGGAQGGAIHVSGNDAVTLTAQASLLARGDSGGTIDLAANAITVAAGAKVLVDGKVPGGTIMLAATGGDLILDGDFNARGRSGGRIEGMASGDVIASGAFAARGDGCIGLSAGSHVDVTGGEFDVPVVDHCP
jgi:hypothetical protein